MDPIQRPQIIGHGEDPTSLADQCISVPTSNHPDQHAFDRVNLPQELHVNSADRAMVYRELKYTYAYLHKGEGVKVPKIGSLRCYRLVGAVVMARSEVHPDADDWVVAFAPRSGVRFDEFGVPIMSDEPTFVDIMDVIKEMLPPGAEGSQVDTSKEAQPKPLCRYIEGSLLHEPGDVPTRLGECQFLEKLSREECAAFGGDIAKIIAGRYGRVLRLTEPFRGADIGELLEALYENVAISTVNDVRPRTAADEFLSFHKRIQAVARDMASLIVDTYMSYALFRGLALFSESLSPEARAFFAERGWNDLSWEWPGFVEPLPQDQVFRATLAAISLLEAMKGDSWIGSYLLAADCSPDVDGDLESVLGDQSSSSQSVDMAYFPKEFHGAGVFSEEDVMRKQEEFYQEFLAAFPASPNWIGFLRCADGAPLTKEQQRSVKELSWNHGYPDRYQKAGLCFTPSSQVHWMVRQEDTHDFFNRDIKESAAGAIERELLRVVACSDTQVPSANRSEDLARIIDSFVKGDTPSVDDAKIFYQKVAERLCLAAARRVVSYAPQVDGQHVDCVKEVVEVLNERIQEQISHTSCNLLEWLARVRDLRTGKSSSQRR